MILQLVFVLGKASQSPVYSTTALGSASLQIVFITLLQSTTWHLLVPRLVTDVLETRQDKAGEEETQKGMKQHGEIMEKLFPGLNRMTLPNRETSFWGCWGCWLEVIQRL